MNLCSRLAYLARYQAAKIAVETPTEQLTYGELDTLARRIAALLRSSGVGSGDVVGLRLRDTPRHLAAFFAVMRLGAISLPLDWRGTRAEFDRIVAQFRPKAILNADKPLLDWSPAVVDLAGVGDIPPDQQPAAELTDRPMAFSLTSGTTGTPKAMAATHEQLHARCATRTIEGIMRPDDRYLSTLPMAYLAGREHAVCPILLGATLIIFPSLFEPLELVDFVNRRDITAVALSPNMCRALLRMERRDGQVLMPALRALVSTTGKLQPEERAALRSHVAPRMIDYYGSTGTGLISVLSSEADGVEPTAVGRCAFGVEVEIADDTGKPLAPGEVGRIRVRGPGITTRLESAADSDEEGVRDGWYYTGDLASIAPNGVLHLHGRNADLIKRGGLMIHAQEVEQALRRHEDIVDAAVVGAPSAELGQEVVAFVVTRTPLDAKDVIGHCRRELAPFKVPSRVRFIDALPRNPNGKVVKAELLKDL